jgi:hypothetical protein
LLAPLPTTSDLAMAHLQMPKSLLDLQKLVLESL